MRIKLVLGLALLCFSLFVFNFASAGTNDNVSGWAWSDTVGWISFNCTDTNSCGTSSYGVRVDEITGVFSGYAWSDNIGWIRMDPEGSYPSGSGTSPNGVKLVGNRVTGWARACTVFASGCSGALKDDAYRGGWDGWISMSGTSPDYGVILDGDAFRNFAWGYMIVGWVDWDPVCASGNPCGGVFLNRSLTVSCNAAPSQVRPGETVTWTAVASGGSGSYTYEWHGDLPLEGQRGNPIALSYDTTGTKVGSVTVTSGQFSKIQSCSNNVNVGSGPPPPSPQCGNSTLDSSEQCDDGNTVNGDGCSDQCQLENPQLCGNGTVNPGEQCDDGNTADGDGCNSTCQNEAPPPPNNCGNGAIDQGEVCDGGNLGGKQCTDFAGYTGGTLGCSSDCKSYDFSQCTLPPPPPPVNCPADGPSVCPECNDGIDNDGDGFIDWNGGPGGEPKDPHCKSASDDSESGLIPDFEEF